MARLECVAVFPPRPPEAVLWFPLNFLAVKLRKKAPDINQECLSKTSAANRSLTT